MQELIKQAIAGKRLLQFEYHGHHRLIEPHVLGVHSGETQVLGYQTGGTSGSGGVPDWRRFVLSGIANLKLTDKTFPGRRDAPSGKHSSWDYQIAVVS